MAYELGAQGFGIPDDTIRDVSEGWMEDSLVSMPWDKPSEYLLHVELSKDWYPHVIWSDDKMEVLEISFNTAMYQTIGGAIYRTTTAMPECFLKGGL